MVVTGKVSTTKELVDGPSQILRVQREYMICPNCLIYDLSTNLSVSICGVHHTVVFKAYVVLPNNHPHKLSLPLAVTVDEYKALSIPMGSCALTCIVIDCPTGRVPTLTKILPLETCDRSTGVFGAVTLVIVRY